uniref:NAAA-beta domain-containing protein n=1 Tax=Rhabditophanes sp. KR3021 TaxID=114890 RepID=A0AC35UEU6_9BILA
MKRLVVVVMICCFLVDCRKRNYRIDLEIDPIDRWKEVIKDYKEQFNEVLDEVVKSNQNPILETVMEYMVDYFALPNLPKDYQDELRGIALVSGRRLDEVLLFNIIYDLTSSHFLPKYGDKEDVSVIAGGQNNTIFHGTNLINMFSPKSQQHILTIEFYQNKNLLFKSNHIPGFIGTITAYKPNHFSISLNLKKEGNDVDNLLSLTSGNFHSIPLTIRKVFEVANSFERAILFLSNTNFIAPSFVTIGGINSTQGAIITRFV